MSKIRPSANIALWASAFVLAGLVLTYMGNPSEAHADMVSQVNEYTVMTSPVGNEEILVVLDSRNEDLLVYRLEQQSLQLHARQSLPELFSKARQAALGRP